MENYLPGKSNEFPFFNWQLQGSLATLVLHEYINH